MGLNSGGSVGTRWKKVELRKSYVTPLGIKEETQTLDRAELEAEQRARIQAKRDEITEGGTGLSSAQRRELLESLPNPNPDDYRLTDFEKRVLEVAQSYAVRPVVEEVGDRMVYIYPASQVLRVAVNVVEVEEEEVEGATEQREYQTVG
jgi:hypothetical protein